MTPAEAQARQQLLDRLKAIADLNRTSRLKREQQQRLLAKATTT